MTSSLFTDGLFKTRNSPVMENSESTITLDEKLGMLVDGDFDHLFPPSNGQSRCFLSVASSHDARLRALNTTLEGYMLPQLPSVIPYVDSCHEAAALSAMNEYFNLAELLLRRTCQTSRVRAATEDDQARLKSRIKMLDTKLELSERDLKKEVKQRQDAEHRLRLLEERPKERYSKSQSTREPVRVSQNAVERLEKELQRNETLLEKQKELLLKKHMPHLERRLTPFVLHVQTVKEIEKSFIECGSVGKQRYREVCEEVLALKNFVLTLFTLLIQKRSFYTDLKIKEKVFGCETFQEVSMELYNLFSHLL